MARYDTMRKIKRNSQLYDYHKAHPEASLPEIGEIYNISAQRVAELIKLEEIRRSLGNSKT